VCVCVYVFFYIYFLNAFSKKNMKFHTSQKSNKTQKATLSCTGNGVTLVQSSRDQPLEKSVVLEHLYRLQP
jgi:hypothetical protein